MSVQLGAMEGARRELLSKTATDRSSRLASGTVYEQTITSVMERLRQGEQTENSSGADLLRKLTKEQETLNSVDSLHLDSTDQASRTVLSERIREFCERLQALTQQESNSLFLKGSATTQEAREAFALSCTADGSTFSLDVKQLAQSQKNVGTNVELDSDSGLAAGRRYFDVTVDGVTTSLVIKISQTDTMRDVLEKVVGAVNRAECGLTAVLAVDEDDAARGHIEITANGTGAPLEGQDFVFSFANQSERDDIVELLSLNCVATQGQDAVFRFQQDTQDTTYMYNSALVDGTVSVTFQKVTDGPVEVSFDYDYDALSQAVEDYVEAYNALKETIEESSYKAVQNYFSAIESLTRDSEQQLSSLGVTLQTDGTMRYNSGFLYQTDMSELKAVLNDPDTSYTCAVQDKADSLSQYMDRLTGQKKKYYGLRAKKRNSQLRELLRSQA